MTRNIKHGLTHSSEYSSWYHMINRCENPNSDAYKNYGGRGIKICSRYRNDVCSIIKDIGMKPSNSHSLDRINNSSHYSCGQCEQCLQNCWVFNIRWADIVIQHRNTRRSKLIEYNGETKTIPDWCDSLGLIRHRVYQRIKNGWGVKEAFFLPKNSKRS